MDYFRLTFDFNDSRLEWGSEGPFHAHQNKREHTRLGGARNIIGKIKSLGKIIRTIGPSWHPAWKELLEKSATEYATALFADIRLRDFYSPKRALGEQLHVVFEGKREQQRNAPPDDIISHPVELWNEFGLDYAVLMHPAFKRITSGSHAPSTYPPYFRQNEPVLIVLVAGGQGADDLVKNLSTLFSRIENVFVQTFLWKKEKEEEKEATESNIREFLQSPQSTSRIKSEGRKINGFIHWICASETDGKIGRSLRVRDAFLTKPQPLDIGQVVSWLDTSRNQIAWQFFGICQCVDPGTRMEIEDGYGGISEIIDNLVVRGRIPTVFASTLPLWTKAADILFMEFYTQFFLKREQLPIAAFRARKKLGKDDSTNGNNGSNTNAPQVAIAGENAKPSFCYYAWLSPVLIWQHQEDKKMVEEIIKSYVLKESGKVILGKLVQELFPGKSIADLYVDCLLQAIKEEPKTAGMSVSHDEASRFLRQQVDLEGIDLHTLGSEDLIARLSESLMKILPLPGDRHDQAQIAGNILKRTHGNLVRTISSKENVQIFNRLMLEQAQQSGKRVDEIYAGLLEIIPELHIYYDLLDGKVTPLADDVRQAFEKLGELGVDIRSIKESYAKVADLLEELASKPLDQTPVGKQIIAYFSMTPLERPSTIPAMPPPRLPPGERAPTVPAILPPRLPPGHKADLIEQLEDLAKLALKSYNNPNCQAETRQKYWKCYWMCLERVAKLISDMYTKDEARNDDIKECLGI